MQAIQSIHLRSLTIIPDQIKVKEEKVWEAKSCMQTGQIFVVKKIIDPVCMNQCNFNCTECNICIHMFSCTCINHVIHHNICKHIHACNKFFKQSDVSAVKEKTDLNEMQQHIDICNDISVINSKDVDLIQHKINLFQSQLKEHTYTQESVRTINYHLDKLLKLATQGQNLTYQSNQDIVKEPHNKKIQPQMRFQSTKKKTEPKARSISKPSHIESSYIAAELLDSDEETLYVHSGFDHVY